MGRHKRPSRSIGVRMIKEVHRLKGLGIGNKAIARTLRISKNTVKKYLDSGSKGSEGPELRPVYEAPWSSKVDWSKVKSETTRGVQLAVFFEENIAWREDLSEVNYVSFWREYKRRFPTVELHWHKIHPPGVRLEIDYLGKESGIGYWSPQNTFVECRLFGGVLCFSQKFFALATHTEKQEDLFPAVVECFEYMGGVAGNLVFDNAKANVSKAHRYDPDVNPEFARLCEHYQTAEIAVRPASPKDKNVIENALGVFRRWAKPKLAVKKFFSIEALNEYIRELCDDFNNRTMKKYGMSREEKFQLEKSLLIPLPEHAYQHGAWKKLVLHPDCHLQVDKNFFSAPHALRSLTLDVRITQKFVEIFHKLERVAVHKNVPPTTLGRYITDQSHYPEAIQALSEFTPRRAIQQAESIGPSTEEIVRNLIEKSRHPLMHLRRVQGILRLSQRYSVTALEGACTRMVACLGSVNPRLRDIEAIIRNVGREEAPQTIQRAAGNPNLRGQESWNEETEVNLNI